LMRSTTARTCSSSKHGNRSMVSGEHSSSVHSYYPSCPPCPITTSSSLHNRAPAACLNSQEIPVNSHASLAASAQACGSQPCPAHTHHRAKRFTCESLFIYSSRDLTKSTQHHTAACQVQFHFFTCGFSRISLSTLTSLWLSPTHQHIQNPTRRKHQPPATSLHLWVFAHRSQHPHQLVALNHALPTHITT
jgi:hypothetical protein